jgi:ring-1,2-phenylacetyl-CoA epoxidase subunit PaaC
MSDTAELDLGPSARQGLEELIGSLADNKAAMGRRYGEWAVSAPTLESAVAAAAMAQDELGHARSTYPLLKQLGIETDDEDRMDAGGSVALLAQPLPDWETFIAVNLVLDGMFTALVKAAEDSTFVPLAQRARKILQEERSHQVHAAAWTRRLAHDEGRRDAFAAAVQASWADASAWAGDDERYAAMVEDGVVSGSPGELRSAVRATVADALEGTPMEVRLA